ncbi:hypothetical protein NM208_g1130 [Fusarium decemcellulare]|uniref:Uncharacterized protein n=1 Tax=Fusarium decemcellulare TaxID=57161 RepID=A0ACC1SXG9_9HYPO|nr:hypothetical protein NM208_g1130 [Fusarium decemcellulare]
MDSRGNANGRPAISRRSVRMFRSTVIRKLTSPASVINAARARLGVIEAHLAPTACLLGERKIDEIAHDIDGIKLLLQGLSVQPGPTRPGHEAKQQSPQVLLKDVPVENHTTSSSITIPQWDHSAHVIDFVKAVLDDKGPGSTGSESGQVMLSLKKLVSALEGSGVAPAPLVVVSKASKEQAKTPMPPFESAVGILRWAKLHQSYYRITWICGILPFKQFEDICCKVYFAVNDYTEEEFIIANSFLSYIFAEHAVVYGADTSREYCYLCRSNVGNSLSRLPLFLPASMEAVTALTLGCLHSIEDSKASRAWTLISTALNMCQTLGYHRLGLSRGDGGAMQATQEQLFWAVFTFENGLSMRLGRYSGIRDTDMVLSIDPNEPRVTKVSRIQRKVYDQLYSPAGLSTSTEKRAQLAHGLSVELQTLIDQTHDEISDATSQGADPDRDPLRLMYLNFDVVCQSSLLALILRAIPSAQNPESPQSCAAIARDTLDRHEQCMEELRTSKDPLLIRKYINWAVLHTPFVPFSILFTHAVQSFDLDDLSRLDRFALSMKTEAADTEPLTHPCRLYELLSQAARIYVQSSMLPSNIDINSNLDASSNSQHLDIGHEMGIEMPTFEVFDQSMLDLGDWYYSNQQLMNLLDEDVMF